MLDGEDGRRNQAEDSGDAVLLLKEIGAITRDAGNFVTEIDVGSFFKGLDLAFRRDLINHGLELVVFERGKINANEFAINSQHRRVAR